MPRFPLSRARRVAATLACVSSAIAATASAQATPPKPPTTIPQMEVVATRIPKAPHDVPASIEIIKGAELRDRGVTTLHDALSLAAGVAVAPGGDQGPASSVIEMWGLREFDAFLLVVDNIPWGGALAPAVASLSLRDVERIEILRGPAPVTYGATSFVGVIHVVHSAAAATASYADAHGGTFGSGGVSADIALNGNGKWKTRLSGDFDQLGFQDDRTAFTRGHVLARTARIEEKWKMWFTADLNVLRQDPASPHVRQGPALSTLTPLDANYNPADAYLNEDRLALFGGFEKSVFGDATWGTTASFARSSQTMFRGFLTSVSNTANNAAGYKEEIPINDFYADTHLLIPAGSKFHFMTGADVLMAAGEAKGATFNYTVPLSGEPATHVTEPSVLDKDSEDERMFFGAYGSADWTPISRFTLSGGVRLNFTSERRGEGEEVTHTKPSGSLGALFSLWEKGQDHLKVFANYRNTFKPAVFDFSLAENEGVLEPETSASYEGGVKVRTMDGKLDLEASAFHMDMENLVTATVVDNVPSLLNSGSTRFQGLDLAADLRMSHSVTARATYSMHDGTFVDFSQDFDGVNTQLGGKRFEMSAKALASAGVTYAPASGFIAHASMNYTGDRYLNKRNTALAPAFSTVDAGIGFRRKAWEIRVDGRNLGDARDAVSESEFGDAQYYRMTARSIQAGVSVRY